MKHFNNKSELKEMLQRYVAGRATPDEKAFIESLDDRFNEKEGIERIVDESTQLEWQEKMKRHVMKNSINQSSGRLSIIMKWTAAAACVLALCIVAGYLYWNNISHEPVKVVKAVIQPGTQKATLTLSDGKRIDLDQAPDGTLASEDGVSVRKNKEGEVVYVTGKGSNIKPGIHTITTPAGGEFSLVLPDGTRVWLNASSSISYPVWFSGTERSVTISGEAYFDVSENKSMPFKVKAGKQEIHVLGTSFNVNSYNDEPVAVTTLVHGVVSVVPGQGSGGVLLKPGQQAISADGQQLSVRNANVEKVTAWKSGAFMFVDDPLPLVLRQLARWYNVKVVITGALPAMTITGEVSRTVSFAQIIDILQSSGVQAKTLGDQLIISNNP